MNPVEDAPDMMILAGLGYAMQQIRAQFSWFNDEWTAAAALLVAAYMVTFNHHADWAKPGGFFTDAPIFAGLMVQHVVLIFGTLWAGEKGAHAASGVPILNQILPRYNQRTNGTTPPAAPTQGG